MARIELRDTTIRIKDGLSGSANIAEATPGSTDTDCDIDQVSLNTSITWKVPLGARFTVDTAGNTTKYTVTDRVLSVGVNEIQTMTATGATAGTFTLTFTLYGESPVTTGTIAFDANQATMQTAVDTALGAAIDTYVAGDIAVATTTSADLTDTTFTFSGTSVEKKNHPLTTGDGGGLTPATDPTIAETTPGEFVDQVTNITFSPAWGTPTPAQNDTITFLPVEVTVKIGDGNLTYTENKEYEYELDRGILDTVREGDEQPMDITIDFVYEFVTTGTGEAMTPVDALKGQGAASEFVSASADPCEPFCVDIEVEHVPDCGATEKETTLFPDFRHDTLEFDLGEATISATGRCNAKEPTVNRATI